MSVVLHIGLPSAADTILQTRYFSAAPGINYMGRLTEFVPLHRRLIMEVQQYDEPAVMDLFQKSLAAKPGVPLFSHASLSAYSAMSPEKLGDRVRRIFGVPKVIYIVRRTADWAQALYYQKLVQLQPDTMSGISPWIEKHTSQLRVGSDLAQAQFTKTLRLFQQGSGASEVLILPYELFVGDPMQFLSYLEQFIGIQGELTALSPPHGGGLPTLPSQLALDASRTIGFIDRSPEHFQYYAQLLASLPSGRDLDKFVSLASNPQSRLKDWAGWWRRAVERLERNAPAGSDLANAFHVFNDYDIREGLIDFLNEIEANESMAMLRDYGIDLRGFGYGQPGAG